MAAEPDEPGIGDLRKHVRVCPACREKLSAVESGTDVLADLRELHDRRQDVRSLVEEMTDSHDRVN